MKYSLGKEIYLVNKLESADGLVCLLQRLGSGNLLTFGQECLVNHILSFRPSMERAITDSLQEEVADET